MTSFYLNCLLKGPISKYSRILRSWELKRQHVSGGRTQFSPLQGGRKILQVLEDVLEQAGPPKPPSSLDCLLPPLLS